MTLYEDKRRFVNKLETHFGNFCIILISKLSNDNFPLCSRAIASRNFAKAGLVDVVVRMASFALFQLFTNAVYVSNTIGFENFKEISLLTSKQGFRHSTYNVVERITNLLHLIPCIQSFP